MLKEVEFVRDWFAETETAPGRLRQVAFRKGTRVLAAVKPAGGDEGTADLRLADGGTARRVPLECFAEVGNRAAA